VIRKGKGGTAHRRFRMTNPQSPARKTKKPSEGWAFSGERDAASGYPADRRVSGRRAREVMPAAM
jgi:hypothetical protein